MFCLCLPTLLLPSNVNISAAWKNAHQNSDPDTLLYFLNLKYLFLSTHCAHPRLLIRGKCIGPVICSSKQWCLGIGFLFVHCRSSWLSSKAWKDSVHAHLIPPKTEYNTLDVPSSAQSSGGLFFPPFHVVLLFKQMDDIKRTCLWVWVLAASLLRQLISNAVFTGYSCSPSCFQWGLHLQIWWGPEPMTTQTDNTARQTTALKAHWNHLKSFKNYQCLVLQLQRFWFN